MAKAQHDFVCSPVAKDYGSMIGAPFKVILSNGVTKKNDKATGKSMTVIVDLPGLIMSILQARVLHPRKLSGGDLKFIRSALHLQSSEVAEILDISPEHYSRCESGTKTLASSTEKQYRMHVFLEAASKHMLCQNCRSEKNADYDPEEVKELVEAFHRVFREMKIQHIFNVEDELKFSFSRRPYRGEKKAAKCDKEDGKWKVFEQQAA